MDVPAALPMPTMPTPNASALPESGFSAIIAAALLPGVTSPAGLPAAIATAPPQQLATGSPPATLAQPQPAAASSEPPAPAAREAVRQEPIGITAPPPSADAPFPAQPQQATRPARSQPARHVAAAPANPLPGTASPDSAALNNAVPCVTPPSQPASPAAAPPVVDDAAGVVTALPGPAVQPPAQQTLAPEQGMAPAPPRHSEIAASQAAPATVSEARPDRPAHEAPAAPTAPPVATRPTAPEIVALPPVAAATRHSIEIAAAPTQPAATSPANPPAAQVAQAVTVAVQRGSDGTALTIRLDPANLGTVSIRIERPTGSDPHVAITAERPETLLLLLRDQDGLRHALTQAGLTPMPRDITYHVATPDPVARPDPGLAGSQSHGFTSTGSFTGSGTSARDERPTQPGWAPPPRPGAASAPPASIRAVLADGIDITA